MPHEPPRARKKVTMDAGRLYTFLSGYLIMKPSTNGWYSCTCPMCGKKDKFALNFAKRRAKCWSCPFGGSVVDVLMFVSNLNYRDVREQVAQCEEAKLNVQSVAIGRTRKVTLELPHGYVPLMDGKGRTFGDRAIQYLTDRGFDADQLHDEGFGYVATHHKDRRKDWFGRIIIPVRKDGALTYYIGRDITGSSSIKYKNPDVSDVGIGKDHVIYNEDALDEYRTVYVMEGIFDAITVGHSATAFLGWTWSRYQRERLITSACEHVVVIADAGFYRKAVANVLRLIDHKEVTVVNLDDVGGKDPNALGRERIHEIIRATPPMTYAQAVEAL